MALPTQAVAADCAEPYSTEKLLADLIATETALREGRDADAKAVASTLAAGLACLDTALPRQFIGRSYRAIGAGMVAGGDVEQGSAWFRTATEVDQAYVYGVSELPDASPVRAAYRDAKAVSADLEVLPDMAFVDGDFKLDGRGIDEPAARPERPHLLQRVDGDVISWVIQGADFPEEVLEAAEEEEAVAVAPVPVEKEKKPKKVKEPKPEKVAKVKPAKAPKPEKTKKKQGVASSGEIKRKRPKEQIPLIVAGGVLLGAAGGLYYMAGQKRGAFNDSNDIAEIDKLQGQVNRLVVASAAVAAVGAGTLTWGIIIDGHGAVPTVRVRF